MRTVSLIGFQPLNPANLVAATLKLTPSASVIHQEVQGIRNENGDVVVAGGNVFIHHIHNYSGTGATMSLATTAQRAVVESPAAASPLGALDVYINEELEQRPGLRNLLDKEGQPFREEIVALVKKNCNGM